MYKASEWREPGFVTRGTLKQRLKMQESKDVHVVLVPLLY